MDDYLSASNGLTSNFPSLFLRPCSTTGLLSLLSGKKITLIAAEASGPDLADARIATLNPSRAALDERTVTSGSLIPESCAKVGKSIVRPTKPGKNSASLSNRPHPGSAKKTDTFVSTATMTLPASAGIEDSFMMKNFITTFDPRRGITNAPPLVSCWFISHLKQSLVNAVFHPGSSSVETKNFKFGVFSGVGFKTE